jgi:hypothetical protein
MLLGIVCMYMHGRDYCTLVNSTEMYESWRLKFFLNFTLMKILGSKLLWLHVHFF